MATLKQKISPFLWFDNQAAEAAKFYCSLFNNSKVTQDTPMVVTFELEGQKFMGMNGGPQFKFNEAISLFVDCEDQKEVDHFWYKLIADGGEESMCGWLKDKYGLSWQIIPRTLIELMSDKDQTKAQHVMQAMLKMRKIDVQQLKDAYNGKVQS
jgi:predicted 3-demethylubiquinone-9 3-methyltransferase (glyoxalase superfamily)